MMDQDTRDIFDVNNKRMREWRAATDAATADIRKLIKAVVGKRVLKNGKLYEITDIHAPYNFSIQARGYRILGTNKRGTQIWDVGFICPAHFDEAEA